MKSATRVALTLGLACTAAAEESNSLPETIVLAERREPETQYLSTWDAEEIIDFACKLGGYVATQKGGAPRYTELDVLREIK